MPLMRVLWGFSTRVNLLALVSACELYAAISEPELNLTLAEGAADSDSTGSLYLLGRLFWCRGMAIVRGGNEELETPQPQDQPQSPLPFRCWRQHLNSRRRAELLAVRNV